MYAKKILAFFTISLFIGLAIIPTINSRTTSIENIINCFKDKSDKSVIYLEASSHYDYGFKVGKVLGFQYRLIDIFARFSKKNTITDEDIKNQINYMGQYCPFILEEFKGFCQICKPRAH